MFHGPCSPDHPDAKCMVDGRCSKQFPKQFQEQTLYGDDGYPSYKCPDNGTIFTHPTSGHVFRNCDVVPHNAYLSAKYNCHINCKICASVKAIKYIYSKAVTIPLLRSLERMVEIKYVMRLKST